MFVYSILQRSYLMYAVNEEYAESFVLVLISSSSTTPRYRYRKHRHNTSVLASVATPRVPPYPHISLLDFASINYWALCSHAHPPHPYMECITFITLTHTMASPSIRPSTRTICISVDLGMVRQFSLSLLSEVSICLPHYLLLHQIYFISYGLFDCSLASLLWLFNDF